MNLNHLNEFLEDQLMFKISFILCGLISLWPSGHPAFRGQTKGQQEEATARLNKNKLTVYLTFKEIVKPSETNGLDRVFFRIELHNNTKWAISCYLASGPKTSQDSSVVHQIESSDDGRVIHQTWDDVFFPKMVRPGKSITFLVSHEQFIAKTRISVEFNYYWERRGQIAPLGIEPSHRVYFSYGELPALVRKKDNIQ